MNAADKIVMRPVASLVPYAKNSRTHSSAQISAIAASLKEFGFTNPVLLDGDNGIIAGHARVQAAQQLGLAEVPTIDLAWLSPEQRQAYVITDNRLSELAGWDNDMLRLQLGSLRDVGFDLSLTGFDDLDLQALFAERTDGLTDPDDAPETPERPVSRTGDLWVCGKHRVLCGDSTVPTDVERALGGVQPHLMVTDPPYGVEYDAEWREKYAKKYPSMGMGKLGGRAIGKVKNDDQADWREAWALFNGDVAYIWHADLRARQVVESLEASGFVMRAQIIWAKWHHSFGRGHYHFQHEPCWYAVRSGKQAHWAGDRSQTTLWQIEHKKSETGHSTQKPVECMRRPIENNSSPGQAVYDPFLGSGTTMIAAEQTGRTCLGLEISPAYVDVIVRRWQAFVGAAATLADDGRAFDEVAAERAAHAAV